MSDNACAYSMTSTHLKLTVKNNDHAYAEHLIPNGQCVVTYKSVIFSFQTLTLYPCASSMMYGGAANFGAAQYQGRDSKFTLDDKSLNLMCKMNNAVPLILHPFLPKHKMLCHIGHLN
jgi:hypothetical protein